MLLCPTLSDPMDCSPPGSSIHGIFQARGLEWGAIAFSDPIRADEVKCPKAHSLGNADLATPTHCRDEAEEPPKSFITFLSYRPN